MMRRVWPLRTTQPQWPSAGMIRSSTIAPSAVMARVSSSKCSDILLVWPDLLESQTIEPVSHLHCLEELARRLEVRPRADQITETSQEPPEREVTTRSQRPHTELPCEGKRLHEMVSRHLGL